MSTRSASAEGYADPTASAAIKLAGQANIQRFVIPGKLAGYNELTTGHWAARNRLKKRDMARVGWAIKKHRINPVYGKAIIKIICYEPNKKRDPSNVRAGAEKIILDALQNMRIIRNDNWRWLEDCPATVDCDRSLPRVSVEIWEA